MVEKSFVIQNNSGLHARPAALLVREAGKFESVIHLSKNGKEVDLKSILGLLSLAISSGETVVIKAEGKDEETAIEALGKLIEQGLGE